MSRRIPLLVLLLASVLVAQSGKPVELSQEAHYKLLLSNDAVRVWRLELGPRQATAMHRHPLDFLQISLQDTESSSTRLTEPPSAPVPKQYNEGEMWYLPRTTHAVKNETPLPLRQIEIELLKRGPSANYTRDAIEDASQPRYFPLPVNPFGTFHETGTMYNVALTRSQLLPGASSEWHEHQAPHLVIAMTDAEMQDEVEGKSPRTVKLNKGEVTWVERIGVRHRLTNTGNRPAQVVTVEYR